MINDLPGYASKKPLSAVLSRGPQPRQTAHTAWRQPAGVPSVVRPSGASVFPAGCRIEHSAGPTEPLVAELEYPLSSEKSKNHDHQEGKHQAAEKTNNIGHIESAYVTPTYMKLSNLALVKHFSELCHCVILTFDHLV